MNIDVKAPLVVSYGGTGLQTLTNNAILVGAGTNPINPIGPLTNGQLLIGSTGNAPVAATLTPGTNITITNSAGGITISAAGVVSSVGLFGNVGSATGIGGTVSVLGDNQSITTVGSGSSLTISVLAPLPVSYGGTGKQTLTAHGVLVGEGTSPINALAVGTSGQVLLGSTGADPTFGTLTSTGSSLTYTQSAGGLNIDVKAPLVVSYGGTGLQTLTNNAILVGAGTNPINPIGPLTNGQLLIGSTGNAPVAATLTPGTNITITNSAGGITISAAGVVSSVGLFGNVGSATGIGGTVSVLGDNQSITTVGSGRSLTISVLAPLPVSYGGTGKQTLTAHGVLVGEGTSPINALAVGTSGQVLLGSTGADPTFGTLTSTGNTLTYTQSAGGLNIDITSPLVVSYGGTGATTFTQNAVLIGNGTSPLSTVGPLTNGQLLIGSTGNAPVAATLTPGTNITITNSAGGITISATGVVTSVALFGNVGSATGIGGTVSVLGDNQSITTVGSGRSLTISVLAPLPVSYGGTGKQTLTAHGVLVGEGTSPINALAVGTSGQVLLGSTGADPTFGTLTSTGSTLTYTQSAGGLNIDVTSPLVVSYGGTGKQTLTAHGVLVGEGTSPINALAVGTSGQVLLGSTGADPTSGL